MNKNCKWPEFYILPQSKHEKILVSEGVKLTDF